MQKQLHANTDSFENNSASSTCSMIEGPLTDLCMGCQGSQISFWLIVSVFRRSHFPMCMGNFKQFSSLQIDYIFSQTPLVWQGSLALPTPTKHNATSTFKSCENQSQKLYEKNRKTAAKGKRKNNSSFFLMSFNI